MGKRISDLTQIDRIKASDYFVISRPGDDTYRASRAQVQPNNLPIMSFPAVRGPTTPAGAPNRATFRLNVGNVTPTGDILAIAKGLNIAGASNWDVGSPPRNYLPFGDLCKLPSGRLMQVYVRCVQESFYNGTTTCVYRLSSDNGASWTDEILLASASDFGGTYTIGVGAPWCNSLGRLFLCIFANVSNGAPWEQYLMYSDDEGVTWSPQVTFVDTQKNYTQLYLTAQKGVELPDGLGPDGSGTLLSVGYGTNIGNVTGTDVTCLMSIDNGVTWTHRATVAAGIAGNFRDVEPGIVYHAISGNLFAFLRHTDNNMIAMSTSSDNGFTWSAPTDIFGGQGKPACVVTTSGAIVVQSRSNDSAQTVFIRTSRTAGATWEQELQFDTRTSLLQTVLETPPVRMYFSYGGLEQISPNLIACSWAGSPIHTTQSDQYLTYFVDGKTRSPLGSEFVRDLSCERIGLNRQLIQEALTCPAYATTDTTSLKNTLNSLLDLVVYTGLSLQTPANLPNLSYWGEPSRLPSNTNDWTNNFHRADSGTLVAAMTRLNGETLSMIQESGVWGTTSNKAVPQSGGTVLLLDADGGVGDVIVHVQGIEPTTGSVQAGLRCVSATNFLWMFADKTAGKLNLYKYVSGTPTLLNQWSITNPTAGNTVDYKITLAGPVITPSVDVNVSGTPNYVAFASYTLIGSDATTYANTVTKNGIVGSSTNPVSFTEFDIQIPFSNFDKFGQLPDLSGVGIVGDLLQTTALNKPQYYQLAWLYNGQPVMLVNGATQYLQSQLFTSQGSPNTSVWVGGLQMDTGGSRSLYNLGSSGDSIGVSAGGSGCLSVSNGGSFFSGPAFSAFQSPYYPQGPMILIYESNGTKSNLYRDGKIIASGTVGTTGNTKVTLGDSANQNICTVAHFSYYHGLLTAAQKNELFRYLSSRFGLNCWNPF